jgi:pyruvate dehydrogenase E2 component (dihydrolipoamide acetyltransferase)
MLDRVPPRLLGRLMRTIAYLVYDLDLDLSRFGVVKDEFGTAMVSNVGVFGIDIALGPLVPFSRTPMCVLMGRVEDRVVAENGRPVVKPMMTLGVTLDHRFMDGYHGGEMARICCEYVQNPEREAVTQVRQFAVVGTRPAD